MEKITSPAVMLDDGRIFSDGRDHTDVLENLKMFGGLSLRSDDVKKGFLTSEGRFVNRTLAAEIALSAGQITEPKSSLNSCDIHF